MRTWEHPSSPAAVFVTSALLSLAAAVLLLGLPTRPGHVAGLVVVLALDELGMGAPGVGLLVGAVGAGAVVSSLVASAFVTGRRLAALEGIGVILWGLPLTLSD